MKNLKRFITIIIFSALIGIQLLIDKSNVPIGYESAKATGIQIISAICGTLLLIDLTYSLFSDKLKVNKEKILVSFSIITILLLATVSTFNSSYQQVAIYGNKFRFFGLFMLASLMLIVFFFWRFTEKKDIDLYVNIFLIIVSINSIIAFTQFLSLDSDTIQLGKYVNGNFGQANFFADTAGAAAGIGFYLFFKNTLRKDKIYYLLICLFNGFLIFVSQSFGGIALIGGLLIIIIFNQALDFLPRLPELKIYKQKKNDKKVFFIFLFLIFTFASITYTFLKDESRSLTWEAVSKLVTQKPLLGHGLDTLSYTMRDNFLLPERFIDRAHNTYLDYMHNLGIISFIISILTGMYLIYKISIQKLSKHHVSILIILACFLLSGVFHTKSIYHFGEFAAILGILIAILTRRE